MDADTLTLTALVETYLARCVIEGKSPRTVQAYRESLERFLRCLAEDGAPGDPREIRPDHVIAYLARYTDHAPDTRHRYFREVRCFFNWLREAGYTENNPFRGLRNVRLPQKVVPPLTPVEIARLIERCDTDVAVGRRDQAILLTLLDTGIRCAEALQLDLADLALADRRLLVRHGKGDKDRIVPFASRCADALSVYLADRGPAPGPLFVAARHGRLNDGVRLRPNGLKQMLRRLGKAAGVPRVHAHRFRHTFAHQWLLQGGNETDLMRLAGWRSRTMLDRYGASAADMRARQAHVRFGPGDRV